MLRSNFHHFIYVFLVLISACDISEDKVKTVIIVDELSKAKSTLTDNLFIHSRLLNLDLQYRVYTPPGYGKLQKLSTIYLLDGQWFLEKGNMRKHLDQLIAKNKIVPLIAVFLDSRDPHILKDNLRNDLFLNNPTFIQFLKSELVPKIDSDYKTQASADSRALAGVSFGAVAAAFAGLQAGDAFHRIGCQSPATHPVPEIYAAYQKIDKLPIKFFLSTGTKNDKLDDTQEFRDIFKEKQFDYIYREVPEGHSWKNWESLLDEMLIYFFKKSENE